MASIFSKIIDGDIPAHFVWQDEVCVAFLVIDPITDGHTVVVPRGEIVEWTQAPPSIFAHLTGVAQIIGQAQQRAWQAQRVGLLVEGYEVPHLHLHVWPTKSPAEFDPHAVTRGQDQQILAENCRGAAGAVAHRRSCRDRSGRRVAADLSGRGVGESSPRAGR